MTTQQADPTATAHPTDPDLCEAPEADASAVQTASAGLGPDELYARLAEAFRALADSTRAKIVHSLLQGELCTCDLAAIVGASEPAVSQHLRVLRNLRVVKARRLGRRVFYSLDDRHVRQLLTLSLAHLGHVEAEAETPSLSA